MEERETNSQLDELRYLLQPLDSESPLDSNLKAGMSPGGVPRETFRTACGKWLDSVPTPPASSANTPLPLPIFSRLLWIKGQAGMGKTVLSSLLTQYFPHQILAHHFCKFNDIRTRSLIELIKSLAFQLASRLPSYRTLLAKKLIDDRYVISRDDKDAVLVWWNLLMTPLLKLPSSGPLELKGKRVVILIDAIDEAANETENRLYSLLVSQAPKLPLWVGWIISSRPELGVSKEFSHLHPLALEIDEKSNAADLMAYAGNRLRPHVPLERHHATAVTMLLSLCEGSFLYVSHYADGLPQQQMTAQEVAAAPKGLGALLQASVLRMKQRMEQDGVSFAPLELLKLVSVTLMPLTLGQLCDLTKCELPDVLQQLQYFRSFLRLTGETAQSVVELCHKNVRDWICDEKRRISTKEERLFFVDASVAHQRFASLCFRKIRVTDSITSADGTTTPASHARISVPAAGSPYVALTNLSSASVITIPCLQVDEVREMMEMPSNNLPSPSVKIAAKSTSLYYAVKCGSLHALESIKAAVKSLSSTDLQPSLLLAAILTYLTHPQYLHMRALIGDTATLNAEYATVKKKLTPSFIEKIAVAAAAANAANAAAGGSTSSSSAITPLDWSWMDTTNCSVLLDALQCFHRFVQTHARHLKETPEHVYQYGIAFPNNTVVYQLTYQFRDMYLSWPSRSTGLVEWQNKSPTLPSLMYHLQHHSEQQVTLVTITPDSSKILTVTGRVIHVWDAVSGEELFELKGHADLIYCMALSANGKLLASASEDKSVLVWSMPDRARVRSIKHHDVVRAVCFAPDQKSVATAGGKDCLIRLWRLDDVTELRQLKRHVEPVLAVCFSSDGRLASGSSDKSCRIWNPSTGVYLMKLDAQTVVDSAAFNPDGSMIVTPYSFAEVAVWNSQSGTLLLRLKGHTESVSHVSFSPTGNRVISVASDLRVWERVSGELYIQLVENYPLDSAAVSRDGKFVVTNGMGCTQVVDASRFTPPNCEPYTDPIDQVRFLAPGTFIAVASEADGIRFIHTETGREMSRLPQSDAASCFAFNADGNHVLFGCCDGDICIATRADNYTHVFEPDRTIGRVYTCEWSHDQKKFVVAGAAANSFSSGFITMRDAESGMKCADLTADNMGIVTCVSFFPISESAPACIVSGGDDGFLRVWRYDTAELLLQVGEASKPITTTSVSVDGGLIAYGTRDVGSVFLRHAKDGVLESELTCPASQSITSVLFHPDGQRLVSADSNGVIRVWNYHKATVLLRFNGDTPIRTLALSQDGQRVAAGNSEGGVIVWSLIPESGCSPNASRSISAPALPREFSFAVTELRINTLMALQCSDGSSACATPAK